MITYEGACCIRHSRRNTCLVQCINHILNRKCSKVSTWAIRYNRFIGRLVATIVWNAEIIAIYGYPFNRNIWATASLAYTKNKIRVACIDCFYRSFNRCIPHSWHHLSHHFVVPVCVTLHRFNSFPCRIDTFTTERIKTGNQNRFHHSTS